MNFKQFEQILNSKNGKNQDKIKQPSAQSLVDNAESWHKEKRIVPVTKHYGGTS